MKRLYHCSVSGESCAEFDRTCDDKGATIASVISTNSFIFGGYTSTSWRTGAGGLAAYVVSPGAFVFSLTNPDGAEPTKYVVEDPTKAAVFHSKRDGVYGPFFGSPGGWGLTCRFGDGFESYAEFPDNYDTTGRGDATFTGSRIFTLDKMEVWSVLLAKD